MRLLLIAVQSVISRPGRSALTAVSLFVGVLAMVVIQAGSVSARDAVVATSALTKGRAVTVALTVSPGVCALEESARLAADLSHVLGTSGHAVRVMACDAGIEGQDDGVEMCLVAGDLRAVRPFPLVSGAWIPQSAGLVIPLAVNEPARERLSLTTDTTATVLIGGVDERVTGIVVGVVEDALQEPRIYAPLDADVPWMLALSTVKPMELLVQMDDADAGRLTALVSTEGYRVLAPDEAPTVVRLDDELQLEKQLLAVGLIFSVVAGLSLIVGALGILNIGLATLHERAEELSLRRSFGATRREVVVLIVLEGQIVALFAAVIALLVGVLAFPAIVSLVSTGVVLSHHGFPVAAAFAGVGASCAAALVGSLAPAIRAGRVPIASIMRG